MKSAVDIYLELDTLENMSVRVACPLGLADIFVVGKFFIKYFEC